MGGDFLDSYKTKNNSKCSYGKDIALLRRSCSPPLSQLDLALKLQMAGISANDHMISLIENGELDADEAVLHALARIFHTSAETLLND